MSLYKLSIALLLAGVGAGQSPDFTNNADFLNGRRYLFAINDLAVLAQPEYAAATLYTYASQGLTVNGTQLNSYTYPTESFNYYSVASGRFWAGPSDTVAVMYPIVPRQSALVLGPPATTPAAPLAADFGYYVQQVVVADFNRDGFSDLALSIQDEINDLAPAQILIATASDTTKPSAPKFGPVTNMPYLDSLTAADFNGDGRLELVGFSYKSQVLVTFTVDPLTLAVTQVGSIPVNIPGDTEFALSSLTVGRFSTDGRQQIALALMPYPGNVLVNLYSLDSQFQPTLLTSTDSGRGGNRPTIFPAPFLKIAAARMSPTAVNDALFLFIAPQIAAQPTGSGTKVLVPYSVDPSSFALKANPPLDFSASPCAADFVIGNFDYQVADPANPGQTQPSLSPQIAYLDSTCGATATAVIHLYALNDDFSVQKTTDSTIAMPGYYNGQVLHLVTPDLQGRSLLLGAPTKIELNDNLQTSVVVAAPPSHVDYITPGNGAPPIVLNISAMPEGFRTSYNTSQKGTNQSTDTHGSSWSFSSKESLAGGVSVGDVDEGDGVALKVTASAAQKLKHDSDTETGSYNDTEYDVSSASFTGDNVWLVGNRLNLWLYPVLGRSICPKTKPGCADADKVPLTIAYSAPDNIDSESTSQDVDSLYQPPWEYGNLFSYPNNYSQLLKIIPNIKLLSTASQPSFSVSGGPLTIQANWSSGGSTGTKTSFTQNYSFGLDISTQGAVGVGKVYDVTVDADVNISGSYGLSHQTTSLNQLDTSTGLTIDKPAGFLDPTVYGYLVTPYIFGLSAPADLDDSSKAPTTDVSAFGALRSAFTADIASSSQGGFWRQAYAGRPDIGLSHRSRWKLKESALQDPPPNNCRPSGLNNSQQDCFDAYPHTPANPWLSPSLYMQGFFVSNAASAPADLSTPGPGPSLTSAAAGTSLLLQARVYNFSLAQMPANSTVHVQFYGIPWDNNQNIPLGNSFKIGTKDPVTGQPQDVVLGPIAPVSEGSTLNWTLASVTFDTTPYADQYLAFWVVVWAETGTGTARTLVSEIQGHGLTTFPANVMTDMTQVPVEMNANVDNTATVTYSNNLGFFRSVFYVSASNTATSTANRLGALASASSPRIRLSRVSSSVERGLTRAPFELSVRVQADNAPVSGGLLRFYDGHPDDGGTLIAVERIGHIRANDSTQMKLLYHPAKAGLRRIWAIANKGTPNESARASRILCVGKSCYLDAAQANRANADAPDPRERP